MATTTTYQVTATLVLVKSKPTSISSTLTILSKGAKIEVISITNSWAYFKYNNKDAYVPVSSITKVITTGSVTIKYLDIDTQQTVATQAYYQNLQLQSYTYTALTVSGYNISGNSSITVTLTQSNPNQTITFYYKKILGSITIRYINTDTREDLVVSKTDSNLALGSYTYSAINIAKYKLVNNSVQTVTLADASPNATITFEYEKILGSITIKYIDHDTQAEIATPVVYSDLELISYTYNAAAISGYSIYGDSSKTIVLTESLYDVTIAFEYTKILGQVTVQYIHIATRKEIATADLFASLDLGSYSYSAKVIDGYTLVGDDSKSISLTDIAPVQTVVFEYKVTETNINEYTIDLVKFGIKNDGTNHVETSNGINAALQYAKSQNYTKVIFPYGTYLIDEANPINIDLKSATIDLGESTLQIHTNGQPKYSIIQLIDGAENSRVTNGTIRGDRDTHDYTTISSTHEWGCGFVFKSGKNCEIDNITITNVPGYGVSTETNVNNYRIYYLKISDIESGSISDTGVDIISDTTTRTKIYYDMDKCNGEYEIGYTLGYMGYPYLYNRNYTAYYYDTNKTFISKQDCIQFKKYAIPTNVKYARFVYPQSAITKGDTDFYNSYVFLSNARPPRDIHLHDCLIKGNRSLGIGYTGGINWLIENNTFDTNGGNAPGYAIDFEDGWELMQDITLKGNTFTNNSNDIVICAGNNIILDNNKFQKWVYFYPRTTDYKFKNNVVDGGPVTIQIKLSSCEISGNTYTNGATLNANPATYPIYSYNPTNENFINANVNIGSGNKLFDSTISNSKSYRLVGSMDNCIIQTTGGSESFGLTLTNCKVFNSSMNLHTTQAIENCTIENCSFSTHSDTTSINFKNCSITNSQLTYSTWASASQVIFDTCSITMNSTLPLVSISAGKTKLLNLTNNQINNSSTKPVVNMYDTSYTTPNGNVILDSNQINQPNAPYVLNGAKINSGIVTFTDKNNTIATATMLNPIYINNPYFNIIK